MRRNHSGNRFNARPEPKLLIRFGMALLLLSAAPVLAQSTSTPAPPPRAAQPKSELQPAFDDEPHFAVSGVKDTSALGGHGSVAVVRERNSLAKEIASLGKNDAVTQPASSAAALDSLRQKAEREPNSAVVHHELAEAEEKSGDPLSAVREYQRAADLDAREDYLFDWASDLLLHHAAEPAIQVFAKGHRSWPNSMRMLIGLGAAEFTLGDFDRAVQEIGAAADLNPNNPAPYLFLGSMLDAEAKSSDALTEKLRRFVSLQPDRADANYYCALALWKRHKESPEATATRIESLLDRAIQLDPNYAAAYLQRGIVYAEQGDDTRAIADYRNAIAADARRTDLQMTDLRIEDAHYRLAQAYRRAGEDDKAKAEIRTYEQLSKESEEQAERERHEIRQFVYTLRDQPVRTP